MRRRTALLVSAALLTGPGPFVAGSEARPLVATPLCGDTQGRSGELSTVVRPQSAPVSAASSHDDDDDDDKPKKGKGKGKPTPKPAPKPPPPPPSVKVATYNVLHGLEDLPDRSLEQRLAMQAAGLAAAGVDVVGVQEASRTTNHGLVASRLATGLAAHRGGVWHWCFFATNPYAPGEPETRVGGGGPLSDLLAANTKAGEEKFEEGIAIVSRLPILAAEARRLPVEAVDTAPECRTTACAAVSAFQSRAALWARVRSPEVGDIDVFSAHTSGLERQHSDLVRWVGEKSGSGRAAVVACDCNATGEAMEPFTRSFVDTWQLANPRSLGYTADQHLDAYGSTVGTRIDYVWLRRFSPLRVRASSLTLNAPTASGVTFTRQLWPSDHYAVVTTLSR
jgi:endonuclease/exonuclease/phosphatase family metal-dependent hydrolase